MTDLPNRWFECPACGREWWTPDDSLDTEHQPCELCDVREMRHLLYALEAGATGSAFDSADNPRPPWVYHYRNRFRVTIEQVN